MTRNKQLNSVLVLVLRPRAFSLFSNRGRATSTITIVRRTDRYCQDSNRLSEMIFTCHCVTLSGVCLSSLRNE
jgi:hypothetical protein